MKTLLKNFYEQKKFTVITTGQFETFLETEIGLDLAPVFSKYVYGRGSRREVPSFRWHPRPYSEEELVKMR